MLFVPLWLAGSVFADELQGLPVREIRIETQAALDKQRLQELLAIQRDDVYSVGKVRQSIQRLYAGIVKLTKSSSIDPQDIGLQPVSNPPC